MPLSQRLALATILAVGLYDTSVGLWMLLSAEPWLAHGPGTLWSQLPAITADDDVHQILDSLFRRMGAFSLFAGLTSLYVGWRFARQPAQLLGFMILYMVAGLGFAVTDARFFRGTAYYWVKQAIGAAWFVATVALGYTQRKAARAAV